MSNNAFVERLEAIGHAATIAEYDGSTGRLSLSGEHLTPGDGLTLRGGRRCIVIVVDDIDHGECLDLAECDVCKEAHDELESQNDDLRDEIRDLEREIDKLQTQLENAQQSNGSEPSGSLSNDS